ncbi:MAG: oxepin-CoA hydrolase, alternative type [Lautropia sp.]
MSGTVLTATDGGVRILTLSNPGARNALSPAIYDAGEAALAAAAADPAVRALLLHGADGFFCAGGNLNRLLANRSADPSLQRESIERLHGWIAALRACPKPIVAAVDGAAAGAGFSLALACDLIVAARDARFVMAYARVGLSPDGGASAALAAALPPQRAFAMLALAEPAGAEELHRAGIVHQLAEPGAAVAAGRALAARLAAGPTAVYGRIKRLLADARRTPLATQLDAERDSFIASLFDDDCGEGIRAFLEKRPARFSGG